MPSTLFYPCEQTYPSFHLVFPYAHVQYVLTLKIALSETLVTGSDVKTELLSKHVKHVQESVLILVSFPMYMYVNNEMCDIMSMCE